MAATSGLQDRRRLLGIYDTLYVHSTDALFSQIGPVSGFRRRMQQRLWRPARPLTPLTPPERFRLLLQDLGPTYVKIGQIISSQGRSLPTDWEDELAKLQSDVRPVGYDQIRQVIIDELGAPPEELYARFDTVPLAAASLAQVHRAQLHDGRQVAVKVQRPNITDQLNSDVQILRRTARALDARATWAEDVDLVGLIDEFGATLLRELDYSLEAYNARRLAAVLAPVPQLHVPDIDYDLSTSRVLTLEYIDGVKSTDSAALDAAGLDREALAEALVAGAVKMLLIDGFFHADPHPGNVIIEPGTGRMVLLDTGMVGEFTLRQRMSLGGLMWAARNHDADGLAQSLKSMSKPFRDVDDKDYFREFDRRVAPYLDPPPGHQVQLVSKVIPEAMAVLRDSGYRLDSQLTIGMKAFIQAEAITAALAPSWSGTVFTEKALAAVQELLPQAVTADTIEQAVMKQATFAAREAVQRMPSLSEGALSWLDQLQKGKFTVALDTSALNEQTGSLRRTARLLTAGILLVGLVLGSAVAAGIGGQANSPLAPLVDYALVLFAVSSAMAAVLAVGLIWRYLRPERRRRRR